MDHSWYRKSQGRRLQVSQVPRFILEAGISYSILLPCSLRCTRIPLFHFSHCALAYPKDSIAKRWRIGRTPSKSWRGFCTALPGKSNASCRARCFPLENAFTVKSTERSTYIFDRHRDIDDPSTRLLELRQAVYPYYYLFYRHLDPRMSTVALSRDARRFVHPGA